MATSEIAIVDYGMANLRSVQKAFERVGFAAAITSDPNRVRGAAKVVLPGVGAFRDAICRIREAHLAEAIGDSVRAGRHFLGICLGMQLVFGRSREDGLHEGLCLVPGEVVRFPEQPGLKVPHMGWNSLRFNRPDCPLLAGLPPDSAVYFVHSYYPEPVDRSCVAAEAEYPSPFAAIIWRDNLMAAQFHPEKSQAVGLRMLKNFAEM